MKNTNNSVENQPKSVVICAFILEIALDMISFSSFQQRFFLTFRDPAVEAIFSKEKDKMLEAYFVCSILIFIALLELHRTMIPG